MKKQEPISVISEYALRNLPLNKIYAHREKNWRVCEGKPWLDNRHEKAWKEFVKAKNLIKHFERTFTASEERLLMKGNPEITFMELFPGC